MGIGTFIGPDEINRRPIFTFGDFLRGIPGVTFNNESIQFRGGGIQGGGCTPNIYIDGARVFADFGITTLIQPEEVEGIEVYRGVAQTPMEWSGLNGTCGVLLIWTKFGRG